MSNLTNETIEILSRRFGVDKVKTRKGRGVGGTYLFIPAEAIIERLNEAFGFGWSFSIKDAKEVEGSILVHLAADFPTSTPHIYIHREVFGTTPVKCYSDGPNAGRAINLGDDYKIAHTDALKKIAASFGVGVEDINEAIARNNESYSNNNHYGNKPQFSKPALVQAAPKSTPTSTSDPFSKPVPAVSPVVSQPARESIQKEEAPKPVPEKQVAVSPFGKTVAAAVNIQPKTAQDPFSRALESVPVAKPSNSVQTAPNPFMKALNIIPTAEVKQASPFGGVMTNAPAQISAPQVDALRSMCKTTGLVEGKLLEMVGIHKDSILKLTSEEAVKVIRFGNTLPQA